MPSFSRPSVSDDNPYSEALFKTLKNHQGFPNKPFDSLGEARGWVQEFQHWRYNEVHRHNALKFVTPVQRYRRENIAILDQRHQLYEAAREAFPGRWSRTTRNWTAIETVYLNPVKPINKEIELKQNMG